MRLNFQGELIDLKQGIEILSEELNFEVSESGIPVKVEKSSGNIQVVHRDGKVTIKYDQRIHFFRALGLLIENLQENNNDFEISEEPQFSLNGAMFDVSRNAVLTVDSIKKFLRKLALMGLNMMMLYTEDIYTIDENPYFGYMRGKYSYDELKECDDYADALGIEMIPCIQTLAHLAQALKWKFADEIKDTNDILLADNEKTYEFIEQMIRYASAPFRSKRIHIGMDEAHNLGLGRYLDLNGYQRRFDIMNRHLSRVINICSKYQLKPMIWSDMYFRLASKTGDYYDSEAVIPEDVIKSAPKDVQLVYWDYYHIEKDFYTHMIEKHQKFGSNPVFAGGVWTWNGFCVNYDITFASTNAALTACKEKGVREVIATLWRDNGAETDVFAGLLGLQLFAEHGYAKELDTNKLKKRFKFCTGADYEAFMDLNYVDEAPGTRKKISDMFCNPSKYILWQDILLGLFDKNIEPYNMGAHYADAEKRMAKHTESYPQWNSIFHVQQKLCSVLSLKSEMGIRIKKFYDQKDLDALRKIAEIDLPELYKRVQALRIAHRDQWLSVNKPFGWEVLDIRYGGLLARIDTAIARLSDYIAGKISAIPELEEERLYFNGPLESTIQNTMLSCNQYVRIATASPL